METEKAANSRREKGRLYYQNNKDKFKAYHKENYEKLKKDKCSCGKIKSKNAKLCKSCWGETRKAENHPLWKGDDVSFISLHQWVRYNKKPSDICENCKQQPPYDVANISGEYHRDVLDFKWLCRSCHMKEDGRMKNLRNQGEKK